MQLSREQLVKLDYIIERYIEDETIKEASTIKEYLNTQSAKIQELLITVYFNLSRTPTGKERKILNEHKINLFNRLQEKGYIKYEEKRTTQTTKQRVNNEEVKYKPVYTSTKVEELYKDKVEKLNRYRHLREQLYKLFDLLEDLQEKQQNKSYIQTIDYTKVKVKSSRTNYDFTGLNLLSKVQGIENKISILKIEVQKEEEWLLNLIDKITDRRTKKVIWWRYYMLEEWKKVARLIGLSNANQCIGIQNEYLAELDI